MSNLTLISRPGSPPGFRFSLVDGVVIVVASVASVLLWDALDSLGPLLPVVVAHFFLFCNVFRVRRSYELAWAVTFVVNLSAWWISGHFSWPGVLLVQLPITSICLTLEILSPRYHGIGYAWLGQAQKGDNSRAVKRKVNTHLSEPEHQETLS